jgi:peptidoglycan/LPS O-acetylase OafA/YrhL
MRRLLLTLVMVLMGAAMVAGSARALFGDALAPLDKEIGTNSSAAAAVLGIGLMAAAIHPANNIPWVRAGILYGFVTVAFEIGAYYLIGSKFYFGPIIFGLACSLLLIALYPQRAKLVPPLRDPPTAYRLPTSRAATTTPTSLPTAAPASRVEEKS